MPSEKWSRHLYSHLPPNTSLPASNSEHLHKITRVYKIYTTECGDVGVLGEGRVYPPMSGSSGR